MTYQIYIYTLALKDGYYYVGKTIDPDRRFNEHFSDKGAVWTKLHPPVSVIEKESRRIAKSYLDNIINSVIKKN